MQHFCNHGYNFERRFSPISFEKRIVFMIWIVRDDIKDQFSFHLRSLAKKGRSYICYSENNVYDVT